MRVPDSTRSFWRVGTAALLLGGAAFSPAADTAGTARWPWWRGPLGNGVSPDGDPPVSWSEKENVRFKVPIDGPGLATPIVWGDRIYVLSALSIEGAGEGARPAPDPSGTPLARQRFLVTAYDRRDGSVVWRRVAIERVPHEGHHLESSWATASPVTDGERVYAHFGSAGTYAYDLEGNLVWKVDLGDMTTRLGYGEGSSPALWGDTLVINWDHEGDSFVVALDKRTGKERWRKDRPGELTSWSTPLILEQGGRVQVIVAGAVRTRSY
ncbi:MAG TPA: PQQ-binding-like beta-propeller repeat protein, partial [Vicinamibacteria bacterium]